MTRIGIRHSAALLFVVAAAWLLAVGEFHAQQPTFRAGVELIAVDVQVVDRGGAPIGTVAPDKFSVRIDGHERKVVSVDLVQQSDDRVFDRPIPTGPMATNHWPATGRVGRTFVLAVDVASFNVEDSRGAVQAARGFVERLPPNDVVGLFSYPAGPRVDPTFDRTRVRHELETIVGSAQSYFSQYGLSPADVVDINAEVLGMASRAQSPLQTVRNVGQAPLAAAPVNNNADTLQRVQLRECGSTSDARCAAGIQQEAQALGFFYQGELDRSVNGLADLLRRLAYLPGRKTVIVISGGMPVGDRLGGRPSAGDAAKTLSEEAARASTNVYALHIDSTYMRTLTAENRRGDKMPASQDRQSVMMGRFLDEVAGTSGGVMLHVLVGSGEQALNQILHETSAYYILGVAPTESDRDGRTHRLKVGVAQRDATVRSRNWVVVPKRHS